MFLHINWLGSHDDVATVLRQNGAALNFAGKRAGVLMCQVFQQFVALKYSLMDLLNC